MVCVIRQTIWINNLYPTQLETIIVYLVQSFLEVSFRTTCDLQGDPQGLMVDSKLLIKEILSVSLPAAGDTQPFLTDTKPRHVLVSGEGTVRKHARIMAPSLCQVRLSYFCKTPQAS